VNQKQLSQKSISIDTILPMAPSVNIWKHKNSSLHNIFFDIKQIKTSFLYLQINEFNSFRVNSLEHFVFPKWTHRPVRLIQEPLEDSLARRCVGAQGWWVDLERNAVFPRDLIHSGNVEFGDGQTVHA